MRKASFNKKRLSMTTVGGYSQNKAVQRENFSGFDSFEDIGEEFSMAAGVTANRSSEPYNMTIVNAGATEQTAILFGRNKFGGVANFGSGADITITMGVAGVPYEQLLQQSASEPFEAVKIRLSSADVNQLNQSITYVKTDATGQEARTPITVSSYLSPDQFQSTLRDIDYKLQIDGSTYLEYPVLAAKTVTMAIYISAKVNIAKPLMDKAAVTEFNSTRVRSFSK